ncbi:Ankyrin repeat [Fusarium oxysporum f. sp. vasinfectum]|nr:Ankyrin repeat [Fusarium oxysporum f. sp. vasinfectum]
MDSRNTKLLAYSGSGSGGGVCNQKKNELGTNVPSVQLQKYCCDVHDEDIRFEDCQIMKDVGPFPDKPGLSPYYCRSGCPPDRIRVAMDTEVEPCSYAKIGGWAFCCKSSFGYKKRNQNPKVTAIKDVIRHWANEPTCPNKRSDLDKRSSSPEELFSRADTGSIDIDDILGDILSRTGSPDILDAAETSWDNLVEPVFPELTIKNIKRYLGLLCARGGDASIQNTGQTPLHTLFRLEDGGDYRDYFREKNSVDAATVTTLLAHGASPADIDMAGDTPLHIAAANLEWADVLSLLLVHGADPALLNLNGQTALHRVAGGTHLGRNQKYKAPERIRAQEDVSSRLVKAGGVGLMDLTDAEGMKPREIYHKTRQGWKELDGPPKQTGNGRGRGRGPRIHKI